MDFLSVGPCKPEKSNWKQNRSNQCWGKSGLWWSRTSASDDCAHITLVVEHGSDHSKHHTDGDSDEGQATNARAPSTSLLEHDGERGEAHVESAVDDGHVDGGQEDNGFLEEKDPWAQESNLELRSNSQVMLADIYLGDVHVAGLLGQGLSPTSQKYWCAGLGDNERVDNPDNTGEDGHHAFDPAPSRSFTQETTSNRACKSLESSTSRA